MALWPVRLAIRPRANNMGKLGIPEKNYENVVQRCQLNHCNPPYQPGNMKWFGKYYELFLSVRFVGAEPRAPVAGPGEVRTNQKRFKKNFSSLPVSSWVRESPEEKTNPFDQSDPLRSSMDVNDGRNGKRALAMPWSNRALTFKRDLSEELPRDSQRASHMKYLLSYYG